MASPRWLPGRIQLKLRRKCRSRPVSRVRNAVGVGRFPVRLGATTGREYSGWCDWSRRVMPLARHRTADYVRCVCLTVNCGWQSVSRGGADPEETLNLGRVGRDRWEGLLGGHLQCCRTLVSRGTRGFDDRHHAVFAIVANRAPDVHGRPRRQPRRCAVGEIGQAGRFPVSPASRRHRARNELSEATQPG
jgi:hypothetical protein